MIEAGRGGLELTAQSEEIHALQQQGGLPDHYREDLHNHVTPLAMALQRYALASARPILVGMNGCQGSGKSTLARFLAKMLHIGAGMRCVVVSIDDFYLDKAAREQLARDVHPLLITRGVPGTHDLPLANSILDALLDSARKSPVKVPVFNKSTDDREPPDAWPSVAPGVDLVILEGWCVGCPPQDSHDISDPVNALEQNEDPDHVWRCFINASLASGYRQLFERLDLLIMLAAPSFECVYQWREQQERQLAQSLTDRGDSAENLPLLNGLALHRFIHHFERLTRHQLSALAPRADAVIELAPDHRMVAHTGRLFA